MNWQMPRWLAGSPCTVGCEHVTRVPYIEFTDMNILYTSISHMIFLINAYVHIYIYIYDHYRLKIIEGVCVCDRYTL